MKASQGIGTLSEKSIHGILKEYFSPSEKCKEVKIEGMIADVFTGSEILEIQTKSFEKMRKKLSVFLELYPVTIIYPIIRKKEIILVSEATGEVLRKRKSPVTGAPAFIFKELYKLKPFLSNPNLKFHIVVMDAEDYRIDVKNGRKSYTKIDSLPTKIIEEKTISGIADYEGWLPGSLSETFTSKDLAKNLKVNIEISRSMLNVLHHIGVVKRVGKIGNSILYSLGD